MSLLNWGKLVSQGRAKAPGISWSDEEAKAVALLAKTFNKKMAEVAHYVRKGILTIEDYKEAQDNPGAINPFLKLSKPELLKRAQAAGLSATPDATVEVLAQMLLSKKREAAKAKAEAKPEKTEIEGKGEIKPDGKVKSKITKVKPKAKAKPKAKPKAPAKKAASKKTNRSKKK